LKLALPGDLREGSGVTRQVVAPDLPLARFEEAMAGFCTAAAQLVDGLQVLIDATLKVLGVVLACCRRDTFDGYPQVGHVLPRRADDRHREGPDRCRQLVADLFQRPIGMRCHQHPLALREQM
jgi:hypothetical protein